MKSAVINIKVDPKIKKQAQSVADELGFSLSALITGYLKQLVRTKSVSFGRHIEYSQYLINALKESETDIKKGRVSPGFENAKDAIAWLNEPDNNLVDDN